MDSTLTIKDAATRREMPCPCCGRPLVVGVKACECGARFVGLPLDDAPLQVRRYGAAMIAGLLFFAVLGAVLVFTKWLAFLSVVVIWASWRAMKLARTSPDWYGGYRAAATTLTITLTASVVAGTYAVSRIPQALDNYRLRQVAATQASMYHVANALDEYRKRHGSYPRDTQETLMALGDTLPTDYWDNSIKPSFTGTLATGDPARTGISLNSFELRSAGPDGIEGTDDDIIMRDGIFYTNAEIKRQKLARAATGR